MIFAIFLDVLSAGLYFFQRQHPDPPILTVGLVLQAVMVIALLVLTITYKGKRYRTIQPVVGVRHVSIRFAVIILSLVIHGIVEFLYILNFFGINKLIFLG